MPPVWRWLARRGVRERNEEGADGNACVSIISWEEIGVPQEEQNRLASEISEEQEGQLIMNSSAGFTVTSDDSTPRPWRKDS